MKLESTLDRRPALLHLAPVLDVMALMVVFFLLGSSLIHHSGVGIELPVSSSQLPPLASSHVILITAGDPPLVLFDRGQISYAELLARLEEKPEGSHDVVYFKMDRRLPSGTSMEVVNAALKGGFQVFQATNPKKEAPAVAPPAEEAAAEGATAEPLGLSSSIDSPD